jgi:hypothetical protein
MSNFILLNRSTITMMFHKVTSERGVECRWIAFSRCYSSRHSPQPT